MFLQKSTRGDDVPRSGVRVTVNTDERGREFRVIAGQDYRLHGLERTQTHSGGAAAGEKAKDHFFPEIEVGPAPADPIELGKPFANLPLPGRVRAFYIFKCKWFFLSLHKV